MKEMVSGFGVGLSKEGTILKFNRLLLFFL